MKLLKRGFIFVMLFALSGVGATFAAGTANDNIQNFFLGNAPATSGDLNQVLALLVGPQGPPGAAGVAGKDGFVGLNGQDGRDGIDGAPGVAGAEGRRPGQRRREREHPADGRQRDQHQPAVCSWLGMGTYTHTHMLAYTRARTHTQGYVEMCLPMKDGGSVLRVLGLRCGLFYNILYYIIV
jgi:hypothetical protein